jgi:hypothetical protein
MNDISCRRCGGPLETGAMSVRCTICGDIHYLPDADNLLMWREHRQGLMFKRGGWRLIDVFDPPAWFLENVI